jgi:hypothetical protein
VIGASLDPLEREEPWSTDLLRELRTTALFHERREAVLRAALDALARGGVQALILKGAGLAYTVYAEPYLRPRVDVDLLIRRESLECAERLLIEDGWLRNTESDTELASAQRHYTKAVGPDEQQEHLDLHWRVVNPLAFAHAVSFDELLSRAIRIPALGSTAQTLASGDALFLACVHLVAHHPQGHKGGDTPELLWLLDIHLLVRLLDARERERFLGLAARKGMPAVCRRALQWTACCFAAEAEAALIRDLPNNVATDVSYAFGRSVAPLSLLGADLASLPSWRQRASLIREHLFPSLAYLQSRYPTWPSILLPIASLHRIVAGAPKWFRSPHR